MTLFLKHSIAIYRAAPERIVFCDEDLFFDFKFDCKAKDIWFDQLDFLFL